MPDSAPRNTEDKDGRSAARSRRYCAYISYSHADSKIAAWVQKRIEGYVVPRRLVGQLGKNGTIPRRLGKCFRDRDELPAGADLGAELSAAISASDFLIVLCSPAATQSRWVNQEIIRYKQLWGGDRVIALILAGEPGGGADAECFPEALRFELDDKGALTDHPTEPIAADLRAGKDGKRDAILKVIAGLLGIGLDALRQREAQRRQRIMTAITASALALSFVMAALTLFAFNQRRLALASRAEAEDLVEYMLTDLKGRLAPLGKLDIMESAGNRALAHFSKDPAHKDADARGREARALHLLGEIALNRGQNDSARANFDRALQLTEQGVNADHDNPIRLFEHGQSLFWLGQMAFQARDLEKAEAYFLSYRDAMRQAAAARPDVSLYATEYAAALSNLGAMHKSQLKVADAATELDQAIAISEAELPRARDQNAALSDLAEMYEWRADVSAISHDLSGSRAGRIKQVQIYSDLSEKNPDDTQIEYSNALALSRLGLVLAKCGQYKDALNDLENAAKILNRLYYVDPSNLMWLRLLTRVEVYTGVQFLLKPDHVAAINWLARAESHFKKILEIDPTPSTDRDNVEAAIVNFKLKIIINKIDQNENIDDLFSENKDLLSRLEKRKNAGLYFANQALKIKFLLKNNAEKLNQVLVRQLREKIQSSGPQFDEEVSSILAFTFQLEGRGDEANRIMAGLCKTGFVSNDFYSCP